MVFSSVLFKYTKNNIFELSVASEPSVVSKSMTNSKTFIKRPIFLVGAERSGTTVLRLMLDHHPQIAWCNEFEYAVDLLNQKDGYPQLDKYYQWLETHRIFQATGFTIDQSLTYPELINSFLAQKRNYRDKPIVGATIHRHFDRVLQIWPDACFIHIVRDGRDVARSCIGMGWAGNVWKGVERWIEAEHLWSELSQKISADRSISVVYEDLIANPAQVLEQISNFIGVEYNTKMLDYHHSTTYDPPNPRLIGQWRHKMSEAEIQLVESRIASMLTARGYEVSGLPLIKVNFTKQKLLELNDWWKRVEFRIKKTGLPLFVSDYLSRHLGLHGWQKSIKLKLNAIDTAALK